MTKSDSGIIFNFNFHGQFIYLMEATNFTIPKERKMWPSGAENEIFKKIGEAMWHT